MVRAANLKLMEAIGTNGAVGKMSEHAEIKGLIDDKMRNYLQHLPTQFE